MKKFIKKLSKNEIILISSFSPDALGFTQVLENENFDICHIFLISDKILFIQTKDNEKEVVRKLIDEGLSTFYFIGKGQSVDTNSHAKGYIITDHVNMSGKNPLRGVNDDKYGVRFPDMSGTYSQLFNEKKLSKLNIQKSKLFIPNNPQQLSELEKDVISKDKNFQIISNEIYSGVITAKHAGCKSCGLILVESVDVTELFV